MTVLAYPPSSIIADYVRAGVGLAALGAPIAVLDTGPAVTAVLGAGALVFAAYAVRTVRLQFTRIVVDADGVRSLFPRERRIRWCDLRGLRLAYYSTRRDKGDGWFQLTLTGEGARVTVESRVDGFDTLTTRALSAAAANGVALDAATAVNLEALGASSRGIGPVGAAT